MKLFLILLAGAAFIASPAMAFNWTYYDFGGSYFDENNNTSPISYPNDVGYLPSPGYSGEGGEKFDLEGLFFAESEAYLFVGLTSSFGLTAMSDQHGPFRSGDLFFGFNGGMYDFGIDVENGGLYSVGGWNYIPERPGTYGSRDAIKNAVGAWTIDKQQSEAIGNVDYMLTFEEGLEANPLNDTDNGDTWIWEFRIAKTDIGYYDNLYESVTFHNTLECGNDLIEGTYPTNPVPEPTTMLLLGTGLLGGGIYRKLKA